MKFAAVVFLAVCLMPWASAGPLDVSPDGQDSTWEPGDYGDETCGLQQHIVSFTVQRLSNNVCGSNCATYEVCMTLKPSASINKLVEPKTSIMKTCVKDVDSCTPHNFSYYRHQMWSSSGVGLAEGADVKVPADSVAAENGKQCQRVPAGQYADFEVVDGYRCLPTNSSWVDAAFKDVPVYNDAAQSTVKAECHSRPTWFQMLGEDLGACDCGDCTLPKAQCIWRIQVPSCPAPSPSPVNANEVSPGPPCCPELPKGECKDELDQFKHNGFIFEVDLPRCADAAKVAAEINAQGDYGCSASTIPGCLTIKCTKFVPNWVYDMFEHCPLIKFSG